MRPKLVTTLILLLLVLLPSRAQNNPYEIADECYHLFVKAENLVGKPGFEETSAALFEAALRLKDTKAETLYYVAELKNQTKQPASPENDAAVDAACQKLKAVAEKYGYRQYYYYAYQMAQTYYYNRRMINRSMEVAREMQADAIKHNDEYGIWSGDKFLASLYIEQNDFISAKKHLLNALELYDNSTDEVIRRQSPSRLYCDLADTYPIGSDSVRINVDKAMAGAKQLMDTLRCKYYYARLAALDGKWDEYARLRDDCLADQAFTRIIRNSTQFFKLLDDIHEGTFDKSVEEVFKAGNVRQIKVIANVCENNGYKDFAFEVEKHLVRNLERIISRANQSRLSELDVSMGKAALSADLAHKEEELDTVTSIIFVLLLIILVASAVFSGIHIHNLQKNKRKDAARIAELQAANEKVRQADAAKTRFVQNMSHEVRTPLNAIVGFSQLLGLPDGTFPAEEKEEFAGHVVNNSKMLTMLLDDILNASAMDSGNYKISYEEGECNYMCYAAISSAEHRLQPGVSMSYDPLPGGPFTFRTDPRRVQQILINLLTNACKHTSKGSIKLACSLDENPGEVTFSVTDTGPGVPADKAEAIFDRFTKLNEFVQGSGLGLSICRDIASRMAGRVYLDTGYPGPGARFVFVLPVNPPANQ